MLKVLIVAPDAAAGSMIAARFNADGRLHATSVEGLEAGRDALAAGDFEFVFIGGFFVMPHGYDAGSPSAVFIDAHVRGNVKFGRYASVPQGVPEKYTGDIPVQTYPIPRRENVGNDVEDLIVAA